MRLSGWRDLAPAPEVLGPTVHTLLDPVLAALGAEPDPHALPVWGDDALRRYQLFVLSPTGLIAAGVRFEIPGQPPRITARLIRWPKLQLSELAIETNGPRRVVSVTIDGQVFRAADEVADRIAAFVRAIHALEEGRPLPDLGEGAGVALGSPILAPAPARAGSSEDAFPLLPSGGGPSRAASR